MFEININKGVTLQDILNMSNKKEKQTIIKLWFEDKYFKKERN